MTDKELIQCPVCKGNPRRWYSDAECQVQGVSYGSYEDCTNCEDGWVEEDDV